VTWHDIIRDAAVRRFYKTGLADPFLLAHRDLMALCAEVSGTPFRALSPHNVRAREAGYLRIQVRVYVPELKMQVMVDEWEKG
jgi:hypothetical protein